MHMWTQYTVLGLFYLNFAPSDVMNNVFLSVWCSVVLYLDLQD